MSTSVCKPECTQVAGQRLGSGGGGRPEAWGTCSPELVTSHPSEWPFVPSNLGGDIRTSGRVVDEAMDIILTVVPRLCQYPSDIWAPIPAAPDPPASVVQRAESLSVLGRGPVFWRWVVPILLPAPSCNQPTGTSSVVVSKQTRCEAVRHDEWSGEGPTAPPSSFHRTARVR